MKNYCLYCDAETKGKSYCNDICRAKFKLLIAQMEADEMLAKIKGMALNEVGYEEIAKELKIPASVVQKKAAQHGILLKPEPARLGWLQHENGTRKPRNIGEVIRMMLDDKFVCPADRSIIKQERQEHEKLCERMGQFDEEGKVHPPCKNCPDDVWWYCSETECSCQLFDIWCGNSPGETATAKNHNNSEGWK